MRSNKAQVLLRLSSICIFLGACSPGPSPATPSPLPPTPLLTAATPTPTLPPTQTPTSVPTATSEPRTLSVCMGAEPDTLYIYGGNMHAMRNVHAAIYDGPIDPTGFGYQPVILEKLPSLADGDALIRTVAVSGGDLIFDADGIARQLAAGVRFRPAGCRSSDCAVEYADGTVEMDQMVARFTMLPGLLWSDGHPLTARDSVFSFQIASSKCDHPWDASLEKVNCGSLGEGNALENTASNTMLDERSVEWVGLPGFLDPSYQTNFAHPLPAHQLGTNTAQELYNLEEARTTPLGWGPYRITAWDIGQEIRMERNPHYHRASEGLPKFDYLVLKMVGGEDRNIDMLLSGTCDILDLEASIYLDFETLLELQDEGEIALDFGTGTVWEHVDFGIRPFAYDDGYQPGADRPDFFGDVRTRQAIAHCIDRGAIEQQVLGGFSSGISASYIPVFHPLANLDVPTYPFDPATGSALLDAVGWIDHDGDPATPRVAQDVPNVPDGSAFSIHYWTTTSETRQRAAEIIKNSLASCGIEANLTFRGSEELFREEEGGPVFGRGFDLVQFAWLSGAIPQCDLFLSENIPGPPEAVDADGGPLHPAGWFGTNTPGFSNAEYDQACLAALALLPGEPGFVEAHMEAQTIFAHELPVIPLYLRLGRLGFFTISRPDLCNHSVDSNGTDFRHIEEYELGAGCP